MQLGDLEIEYVDGHAVDGEGYARHGKSERDLLIGHRPPRERELFEHPHDFLFHLVPEALGVAHEHGKAADHLVRLIL